MCNFLGLVYFVVLSRRFVNFSLGAFAVVALVGFGLTCGFEFYGFRICGILFGGIVVCEIGICGIGWPSGTYEGGV